MRAPALYALLLLITGILIGVYTDVHPFVLFSVAGLAIAATIVALALGRTTTARLLLMPAIVVAGTFLTQLQTGDFPANHISNFTNLRKQLVVTGTVMSEPDIRPTKTFLTIRIDSLSHSVRTIGACGQLRLRIAEPTNRFNYRDRIRFESWVNQPYGARNPGAFDYKRYLEIREIHAVAYVGSKVDVTLLQSGAGDPFVRDLVVPVRDYISRVFDREMDQGQSALLKGFLLGDVRFIPREIYRRFKDTGTLHVLAASGANVGYVVGALLLLSRLTGVRRRLTYGLAIAGVIVFSFLAFNQPSVVRASVMAIIVLLGRLLRRDANWLNTISLAGVIILAFRPLYLFDLGAQLSFAAAFSLILFLPVVEPVLPAAKNLLKRGLRYLMLIFWSTLVAQAGVLPILLYHFQTVPLVSFIANLVVVPVVGMTATLGICLAIFSGVPYVSSLLGKLTGITIDLTLKSIAFFESWQIPPIEIGAPELLTVILYYLICHFTYLLLTRNRMVGVFAMLLIVVVNAAIWKDVIAGDSPEGRITILDTWQVPTLVIENAGEETTLINGGGLYKSLDRGESVVLPFLRYRGIDRIDRFVLTDTSRANLKSLQSVAAHLSRNSALEPAAINPAAIGSAAISPAAISPAAISPEPTPLDTLTPYTILELSDARIVLLLNKTAVADLNSSGYNCDILILDWYFAHEEKLSELISLFQPETVIVATYPSRYLKPDLLDRFRAKFPNLRIHFVRDEGAVEIETDEGGYRVSTMPNG